MKYFLFVNLVLISLLIRPLTSPALPGRGIMASDTVKNWDPVFGNDFQKALFRTTFDISKNHLTGFIYIKKTSDTSYRILFSNDFGMQMFDFEFSENKFIVHYCFPSLDRKSLLKLLDMDFRILLFPNQGIKKISPEKTGKTGEKSFKIKATTGKWTYRISSESRKILSIRSVGKFVSKTWIDLIHSVDTVTGINISNPLIKLSINLSQISR
jgi:hypothetical protein